MKNICETDERTSSLSLKFDTVIQFENFESDRNYRLQLITMYHLLLDKHTMTAIKIIAVKCPSLSGKEKAPYYSIIILYCVIKPIYWCVI